ncbi:MAG: peptidase [Acidobacteria bacterium]|nr:peptidase [Acidobacteriota bacterium]
MFDSQRCTACGTELSGSLLACPVCHTLVHRDRLSAIAAEADAEATRGDKARAALLWREALTLLPEHSKQHDAVARRVEELTLASGAQSKDASRWKTGGIGALIIGALTKGKLLIAGLLKLPTLISMLAFAGVYWSIWGWQFAIAIVIAIYIHEIGHVAALRARGLPASAPMFIPGVGAFVRLQGPVSTPREDSYIGLSGPIWGLGASLAALALFYFTHNAFWVALASTNAVINMFNLMPVWQLDGSRGIRSLSIRQRWLLLAVIAVTGVMSRQPMLVLVGLVALWRAFEKNAPRLEDWPAFARYSVLVIALAAISIMPVPISGR